MPSNNRSKGPAAKQPSEEGGPRWGCHSRERHSKCEPDRPGKEELGCNGVFILRKVCLCVCMCVC